MYQYRVISVGGLMSGSIFNLVLYDTLEHNPPTPKADHKPLDQFLNDVGKDGWHVVATLPKEVAPAISERVTYFCLLLEKSRSE